MAEQTPTTPTPGPSTEGAAAPVAPTAAAASAEKPADAAAMAADALQSAGRAAQQIADAASPGDPKPIDLPEFSSAAASEAQQGGLAMLSEVNLQVKIELGRTRMLVEDVLRLTADSVIELDKLAGDPVDIYVNDHHVARGEVLVVNDNFCVRVSEIIQHGNSRGDLSRAET